MIVTLLVNLLELLIRNIDKEDIDKWLDMGLDVIEDKYEGNKITELICMSIRSWLDVPDND
jgi:hypothetical protein